MPPPGRGLPGVLPGIAAGAAGAALSGAGGASAPAGRPGPNGGPPDAAPPRGIDDVRGARREYDQGGRTVFVEPGRTIIRENDRIIIRHDETARFWGPGQNARPQRRGDDYYTVVDRPDGSQIVTVVDAQGSLVRRARRYRDGREVVIIDNRVDGPPRSVGDFFVDVPPPVVRIPRERYVVEAEQAPPDVIYETLMAPPVERIERRYSLDEIRYTPNLRARMPSVDLDTINFASGSWEVTPSQVDRLAVIAQGIRRAVTANPNEVFLIEGHTDAVGSDIDNLSLSDRRAQSVAEILTQTFQIPPENLTTQGYGEQYPKVQTQDPSRENRRVTVRRITPLLQGQAQR